MTELENLENQYMSVRRLLVTKVLRLAPVRPWSKEQVETCNLIAAIITNLTNIAVTLDSIHKP